MIIIKRELCTVGKNLLTDWENAIAAMHNSGVTDRGSPEVGRAMQAYFVHKNHCSACKVEYIYDGGKREN